MVMVILVEFSKGMGYRRASADARATNMEMDKSCDQRRC
jgi:hypothetical protein